MPSLQDRIQRFIFLIACLAIISLGLSFLVSPPPLTKSALIVFATLLLLSLISELLALRVTARGTETSMDFVPQLGAILLIGPAAAGCLTAISWSIYQLALTEKPFHKALFNVSQFVVSVTISGLLFVLLGGEPSLSRFELSSTILPFSAAVISYFAINSSTVSYIISVSEGKSLESVWRELSLTPLVFDILISSLALLVTYLYISWNALAMLAVIIPIIGLRYSYGVNLELKQLNSDLIRVLINTIEAQDPYTSGHSLRVAEGAIKISEAAGLPRRETEAIETAALLHDIGKLDSSFHDILKKESDLTEEEWELIKQHPQRGVSIVRPIRTLDSNVLDYIRHHHEHYDGSGYPDGLASDNIPVGARVIMIADTIDAMVTARPYRDRIDSADVRTELEAKAGSQFDPDFVQAALKIRLPERMAEAAHDHITTEDQTVVDKTM